MKRSLALPLIVAQLACSDHITGPQAEAVLTAVEYPLGASGGRERLMEDMGFPGYEFPVLKTASRVVVAQDGQRVPYFALVLERLMVPENGGAKCLGPRWTVVMWRDEKDPEGLMLYGGRFNQELDQLRMCENVGFADPTPFMLHYPRASSADRTVLISGSGRGIVSRGMDAGPCNFLPPDQLEYLRSRMGVVSCRVTRHQVRFRSVLHVPGHGVAGGTYALGPASMLVQLRPATVIGIQYTVDCSAPALYDPCPDPWNQAEALP